MSRHMIIWDEGLSADSVRVYTEDPSVLVISDREDLQVLKEIPEASRAGVYILMGEDNRYVGQASSSVWARINSHNKNKDWWTRVLFFSRVDGHLDKSQLDYLESKLIRQFAAAGFNVDNKDSGNSSYIGPYQRGQAENLLSTVEAILAKDIGLDIFSKKMKVKPRVAVPKVLEIETTVALESAPSPSEDVPKLGVEKDKIRLTSDFAGLVESESWKWIHYNYVKACWSHDRAAIESEPKLGRSIVRTAEIEESRTHLYTIFDDSHSLYTCLSQSAVKSRLSLAAAAVGDSIKIEEN